MSDKNSHIQQKVAKSGNVCIGWNPDDFTYPAIDVVVEQLATVEFKSQTNGGGLVINGFELSQEEWQALVLIMRNKKRWVQAAIHPEHGVQVEGYDHKHMTLVIDVLEQALAKCKEKVITATLIPRG